MKHFSTLLFGSKIPPGHQISLEVALYNENKKRMRLIILITLALTLVFGVGSDILRYFMDERFTDETMHSLIIHLIIIAVQVASHFINQRFFDKPIVRFENTKKQANWFSFFIISYGIIYMFLADLITVPEEFNTALVLIYTLSLMLLTVFILLKPQWYTMIFMVGLAAIMSIILEKSDTRSLAISTASLCIMVSGCGYVIATYFYNNFVQNTLNEETIKFQQQSLERSFNEKDAILSIVAHDLRTPVANIDQLTNMVDLGNDTNSENILLLSHIKESCRQAYQIIDDLLDSSDSKIKDEDRSVNDLQDVFKHALTLNEKRFLEKNIQVKVFELAEPVLVEINRSKFERVFANLLNNAAKFTHTKGTLKVQFKKTNKTATVVFEDSGIGIPDDITEHLFKPFSKARRKGIDGEKTTGLGLSIVKNIIDLHNGTIHVTSKVSKGTKFTIELPLAS